MDSRYSSYYLRLGSYILMSKDEEFEKLKSEVIEFKHQIEMRTTEHEFRIHKQVSDLKLLISNGLTAGLFAIGLIVLAVFLPDLIALLSP